MTYSALAAAFIPGYPGHIGGDNGTITRVVIHGTVSPLQPGAARNVARYFQQANSGGLAHYVVDADEVVACADEEVWTWGAPPNPGEIHVELCDPQAGSPDRWKDGPHKLMLARAARLVTDICNRHGLPVVRLSVADLLATKTGVTGHAEVSEAWHESDHSDPGADFPWPIFIGLAQPQEDEVTDADIKKIVDQVVIRVANDTTHANTLAAIQAHLATIETELEAVKKKVGA